MENNEKINVYQTDEYWCDIGSIEQYKQTHNDILNGSNGREYGYLNEDSALERTTIPATDGYNLVSTIDANIQSIVEKYLKKHKYDWK